ncbi:G5 domain-containing protein [Curtobacterium sp. MCBD17_003]|uniref:G5 domain-containing protein n=1 Tax=Curtobacterium sp. MCBD17_003 TaxID=2175667 RepID=UPI0021AD2423|nr:G5 domain-containing protein [Curtobacterium sp. MCBD17_003]WIE55734.1 G5 domain-containing protein [Curtobacterium sp. MCBD17_003]
MSWKTMSRRVRATVATAGAAVLLVVGAGCAAATSEPHAVASSTASTAQHEHEREHRVASSSPTPTPIVTTKLVTTTAAIPFASTTLDDATRAKGTSVITTTGVNGVRTTTYRVTYTDGVETGRAEVSQVVTTPPVTQVTSVGTYVAPAPASAPAPAPAQSAVITPGAYCSSSQVGQVAQSASGTSYRCGGHGADARGDYHWNTIP